MRVREKGARRRSVSSTFIFKNQLNSQRQMQVVITRPTQDVRMVTDNKPETIESEFESSESSSESYTGSSFVQQASQKSRVTRKESRL